LEICSATIFDANGTAWVADSRLVEKNATPEVEL